MRDRVESDIENSSLRLHEGKKVEKEEGEKSGCKNDDLSDHVVTTYHIMSARKFYCESDVSRRRRRTKNKRVARRGITQSTKRGVIKKKNERKRSWSLVRVQPGDVMRAASKTAEVLN